MYYERYIGEATVREAASVLGGQNALDAFEHLFAVSRALGPLLLLAHQARAYLPIGRDSRR